LEPRKQDPNNPALSTPHSPRRHPLRWIALILLFAAIGLGIAAIVMVRRATPIIKGRVLETLSKRFNAKVDLDDLQVSLIQGLQVTGTGLRIFPPDDVVAAGATSPLITIRTFHFGASLSGLFLKPTHVGTVHVEGLALVIPPREVRQQAAAARAPQPRKKPTKIKIQVDEIVLDDSQLVIETLKPGKDPKVFVLKHVVLHDFGPDTPWPYTASITNAIPKGEIEAHGTFGPWETESPGDSNLTGHYTFDHADLNPIKGIGGLLDSIGDFDGQLDKIAVHGTANVPAFTLDTANHPLPLTTKFEATVDGTTGDTYLHHVDAVLGHSHFTTQGEIVNVKGKGHIIDLDLDIPAGRLEDFLQLAVKTQPVIMTGVLQTKTHLHIPPGKISVAQKIELNDRFTLHGIHFTNPSWQDRVDDLSLRAQGHPDETKKEQLKRGLPAPADIRSQMTGRFRMNNGKLDFSDLDYQLPGATVTLDGVYTLDGKVFDFHGHARTEAKPSEMVVSGWKSFLLKAVDPFVAKNGAGMELPIKISGTNGSPKFGLDFGHKDKDKDKTPPQPRPKP
jgi:hypothetical protein